jgi:hypothetical protein
MDVAAALDRLVPGAVYFGSLTDNTPEAYAAIRWEDEREKPSWEALAAVVIEPPLAETLESIFLQGIQQLASVVPAAIRWNLFAMQAAGEKALLAGDVDAVRVAIETVALPDNEQVEAIRAEMLGRLPQ